MSAHGRSSGASPLWALEDGPKDGAVAEAAAVAGAESSMKKPTPTIPKPKRPMTAYNFFFREERQRILEMGLVNYEEHCGDGEDDLLDESSHASKRRKMANETHVIQKDLSSVVSDDSRRHGYQGGEKDDNVGLCGDDVKSCAAICSEDGSTASFYRANGSSNDTGQRHDQTSAEKSVSGGYRSSEGNSGGGSSTSGSHKEKEKNAALNSSIAVAQSRTRGKRPPPHGKVSFEALGRVIARRWKQVSSGRLAEYKRLANLDKERYRREMKKYDKALISAACLQVPGLRGMKRISRTSSSSSDGESEDEFGYDKTGRNGQKNVAIVSSCSSRSQSSAGSGSGSRSGSASASASASASGSGDSDKAPFSWTNGKCSPTTNSEKAKETGQMPCRKGQFLSESQATKVEEFVASSMAGKLSSSRINATSPNFTQHNQHQQLKDEARKEQEKQQEQKQQQQQEKVREQHYHQHQHQVWLQQQQHHHHFHYLHQLQLMQQQQLQVQQQQQLQQSQHQQHQQQQLLLLISRAIQQQRSQNDGEQSSSTFSSFSGQPSTTNCMNGGWQQIVGGANPIIGQSVSSEGTQGFQPGNPTVPTFGSRRLDVGNQALKGTAAALQQPTPTLFSPHQLLQWSSSETNSNNNSSENACLPASVQAETSAAPVQKHQQLSTSSHSPLPPNPPPCSWQQQEGTRGGSNTVNSTQHPGTARTVTDIASVLRFGFLAGLALGRRESTQDGRLPIPRTVVTTVPSESVPVLSPSHQETLQHNSFEHAQHSVADGQGPHPNSIFSHSTMESSQNANAEVAPSCDGIPDVAVRNTYDGTRSW